MGSSCAGACVEGQACSPLTLQPCPVWARVYARSHLAVLLHRGYDNSSIHSKVGGSHCQCQHSRAGAQCLSVLHYVCALVWCGKSTRCGKVGTSTAKQELAAAAGLAGQ